MAHLYSIIVLYLMCIYGAFSALVISDSWVQMPTPTNPPTARDSHTAAINSVNLTMIVFGGRDATGKYYNDIAKYDLLSNAWTTNTSVNGTLPTGRYGHTAVVSNTNCMVIFGGQAAVSNTSNQVVNDLLVYNLLNDTWLQVIQQGVAPSPRMYHSAVLNPAQNTMLVHGGIDGNGNYLNDLYCLDLNTWAWTTLTPVNDSAVPTPRSSHAAVFSPLNELVVYGGWQGAGAVLGDVSCYSLSGNNWYSCSPDSSMPSPRARYGHTGVLSPLHRFVIFGGMDQTGTTLVDVWNLDLFTFTWSTTSLGSAFNAKLYASACATPFGSMVVWGGTAVDGSESNELGLYNLVATILRSVDDGITMVVLISLVGTILIALCFAMDYLQEQSKIDKHSAILKAREEGRRENQKGKLSLPLGPLLPKLQIPLGPKAQKFVDEITASLDPMAEPEK